MRRVFGISALAATALACATLAPAAALAQVPAPPASVPLHSVIYTMEQLRTGPLTPEIQKQLVPLNTMAEVEALLKVNRIAFAWRIGDVASTALPPEVAGQIAALKPTDIFVVPIPDGALIGAILSQH